MFLEELSFGRLQDGLEKCNLHFMPTQIASQYFPAMHDLLANDLCDPEKAYVNPLFLLRPPDAVPIFLPSPSCSCRPCTACTPAGPHFSPNTFPLTLFSSPIPFLSCSSFQSACFFLPTYSQRSLPRPFSFLERFFVSTPLTSPSFLATVQTFIYPAFPSISLLLLHLRVVSSHRPSVSKHLHT